MLVLIAIFAYLLRDTGFMSPINLLSIVRVSTTITIMSIAIVFVLCAGEIDLSIAAIVPVSALITALMLSWNYNFLLAALTGVMFGAGVGFLNGLAVVFFKIPSFVVTLGSMGIMQGLAQIVTNASTVSIANDPFFFWFGGGSVGPIPILAFWSLGGADHRIGDPLPHGDGPSRARDWGERGRGAVFRHSNGTGESRRAHGERRGRRARRRSLRRSIRSRQFHDRGK